jgi:hypothetical protein
MQRAVVSAMGGVLSRLGARAKLPMDPMQELYFPLVQVLVEPLGCECVLSNKLVRWFTPELLAASTYDSLPVIQCEPLGSDDPHCYRATGVTPKQASSPGRVGSRACVRTAVTAIPRHTVELLTGMACVCCGASNCKQAATIYQLQHSVDDLHRVIYNGLPRTSLL